MYPPQRSLLDVGQAPTYLRLHVRRPGVWEDVGIAGVGGSGPATPGGTFILDVAFYL